MLSSAGIGGTTTGSLTGRGGSGGGGGGLSTLAAGGGMGLATGGFAFPLHAAITTVSNTTKTISDFESLFIRITRTSGTPSKPNP
jgi:hypothetical protein